MSDQNQPETIGQYLLSECRAEGRIARVCKGVDRATGEEVIVRVVDQSVSQNPQIRAMLESLRNPNSERRVQDPCILRLMDVAVKDNTYYVIHEAFDGLPLDEFISKKRPALRESLALAIAVTESLRAVHGHKIVHGDLKPSNILVSQKSDKVFKVKIALSDLAHHASDAMVSIYGELVGTPKYMAPEFITGRRETYQSDLFSLGVILYELFSGREPFPSGNALSYLHANVSAKLVPLAVADSTVPEDLGRAVDRLLAREPHNRYRAAQSVIDDLEQVGARLDGLSPEMDTAGVDSAFASGRAPQAPRGESAFWKPVALVSLAICLVLIGFLIAKLTSNVEQTLPSVPHAYPANPQLSAPIVAAPPATQVPAANLGQIPIQPPAAQTPEGRKARAALDKLLPAISKLITDAHEDDAVSLLKDERKNVTEPADAKAIDDEIANVLLLKAARLAKAGQYDESLQNYDRVLSEYPNSPAASTALQDAPKQLYVRATLADSGGHLQEAVSLLETLQSRYPQSDSAMQAAAKLPEMRLRLAELLQASKPDVAMNLLHQVAYSGASSDVVETARKRLAAQLMDRVDDLMRERGYEQAVADLKEIRRLNPDLSTQIAKREPEAMARLAVAYKRQDKRVEAVRVWKELREKYPKDNWVAQSRVELMPLLEAAAAIPQGDKVGEPAFLLAFADKSIKTGDFEAARPNLEQLVNSYRDTAQGQQAAEILGDKTIQEAQEAFDQGEIVSAVSLLEKLTAPAFATTKAGVQAATALVPFKATPENMAFVPAGACGIGLTQDQVNKLVSEYKIPSLMIDSWFGLTMPAHNVDVPAFYMDKYEVTNAEFKAYVDAKGVNPPPSTDWDGDKVKPGAEKKPVRFVNYKDAEGYAAFAGKRLPTEVEWEKAARGPKGLLFPWGNEYKPSLLATASQNLQGPVDVGSYPGNDSPYGIFDLEGNVQEWTSSPFVTYPGAEKDGLPANEAWNVVRGTGWDEINAFFSIAPMRFGYSPGTRAASLGFRCVKDLQPPAPTPAT